MTVVALLADPPREEVALPELVDAGVLTAEAAADLYAAMVQDAMVAVARSGGDLLVNYPPADDFDGDVDPESELRTLAGAVLEDVESVRFEVQVGSDESARIGNTITHLLEREDADTAAVLRPTAPLVDRTVIDAAAMKLRRDEVVLGPSADGRLYYAGFAEPVDFDGALADPPLVSLAHRAVDEELGVGFERFQPLAETPRDLRTVAALVEARRPTEQYLPASTAGVLGHLDVELPGASGVDRS